MKKHVAALKHRLEEISWGISEAMHPDLKIQIAQCTAKYMALHQQKKKKKFPNWRYIAAFKTYSAL